MQADKRQTRGRRFDLGIASELFRVLGDPHRLAILQALASAHDEICVCEFTELLPLNQPTVSHHLRLLRETGLVVSERRGTWVYYRISPGARARLEAALAGVLGSERSARIGKAS